MSCQRLANRLDAYLDGELPAAERSTLDAHARECPDCGAVLARETRIQRLLRAQHVHEPGAAEFDRMLTNAPIRAQRQRRSSTWRTAVGATLAAGVIAWSLVGVMRTPSEVPPTPQPALASVTMTLQETRTVKLVFSSPEALDEARLSLELPPGVELAGHAGKRQVRWMTDLQSGKNVLPLTLVVREGTGGELVARLEHSDRQKTFRVRVVVRPGRERVSTLNRSTAA